MNIPKKKTRQGQHKPLNLCGIHLREDLIISPKDGGTNKLENLWPVCSVCNEGKKEPSLIRKDVLQLLQEINMQPPDIQREVYNFLKKRFE